MGEHQINLRAAKPTFDEGLVFERYLDQAAEGFFRFLFGRRAPDIIASAYTEPDHDFSYQNVTFAERNNVILGMVSGFSSEQHQGSSDRTLKRAAGRSALRFAAVKFLCAPLWRFLDTIHDGDFYLQAIAVDNERRGQGIGSRLIDSIEVRAASNGSTRLVLDVAAKNESARRLYERRGMTVETQWPKPFALGQFRLLRMIKPL
jgi:ribosomal protein S18 acetylase RimI-like enzyme